MYQYARRRFRTAIYTYGFWESIYFSALEISPFFSPTVLTEDERSNSLLVYDEQSLRTSFYVAFNLFTTTEQVRKSLNIKTLREETSRMNLIAISEIPPMKLFSFV